MRMYFVRTLSLGLAAGLSLALVACAAPSRAFDTGQVGIAGSSETIPAEIGANMDRGRWMVNRATKVWKVMQDRDDAPPQHIGYVLGSRYRQMRGGPEFKMYKVTRLDRNDQIGHIDQMGRAIRYEPKRNGTFDEVPVGSASLEENVGMIFDTLKRVTLEPTSKNRMAFESLDLDGDGFLQEKEIEKFGPRLDDADKNGDGVVDYAEFKDVDVL